MQTRIIAIVICLITLSQNVIASEIVNVDRQSRNTIIIPQPANRNIIQSTQVVTAAVASIPAVQKLAESAGPVVQRYAQQLQAMGQRAATVVQRAIQQGVQITFKTAHAVNPKHLLPSNVPLAEIENAIYNAIQTGVKGASEIGNFLGRVVVQGHLIEYRAFQFAPGQINVGTYYVPRK